MRVAITPHELWYDGLESAAQFYMESQDLSSMTAVLLELHEAMNDSSQVQSNIKDKVCEFLLFNFVFVKINMDRL
jgi:hypothetical protein